MVDNPSNSSSHMPPPTALLPSRSSSRSRSGTPSSSSGTSISMANNLAISDLIRRRSSPIAPLKRLELNRDTKGGGGGTNTPASSGLRASVAVISPPPTPLSPTTAASRRESRGAPRLRSNSGLTLHTNAAAFRQYTDYSNYDGSPITPNFGDLGGLSMDSVMGGAGGLGRRTSIRSVQSSSAAAAASSCGPQLVVAEFFNKGLVQAALECPTVLERLIKYAENRGSTEGLEFLKQLKEYDAAVNNLTANMSRISTTWTSVVATFPLRLPSQTARGLNADIKHITSSVLPALEVVYLEARAHIERRVLRDVYPGFVKHQLLAATEAALASSSSSSPDATFPGLGSAFCLTDPLQLDNPVVAVSDGLAALAGRDDLVGQNCRVLQGGGTHHLAVSRVRQAVQSAAAAPGDSALVELVLNYRRAADGSVTPFWNLLFCCPLTTETGRVAHYLGGQVDISQAIAAQDDVLYILRHEQPSCSREEEPAASSPSSSPVLGLGLTGSASDDSCRGGRDDSNHARRRSATRGFSFKHHFRRQPSDGALRAAARSKQQDGLAPPPTPTPTGSSRSSTPAPHLDGCPEYVGAYAKHLVLECTIPKRRSGHKPTASDLRVAFFSPAALALLNLSATPHEEILRRPIFDLLSDDAGAPAVNRAFGRHVTSRLLEGKTACTRITVGVHQSSSANTSPNPGGGGGKATRKKRPGRGGGGGGVGGNGHEEDESGGDSEGSSTTPTRHAQWSVEAAFDRLADWRAFGGGERHARARRGTDVVCHWTPLRDGEGSVRWVVVVVVVDVPARGVGS